MEKYYCPVCGNKAKLNFYGDGVVCKCDYCGAEMYKRHLEDMETWLTEVYEMKHPKQLIKRFVRKLVSAVLEEKECE